MKYYHVVCGKKHMDLVVAVDENHAIEIVRKRWGDSKIYSKDNPYVAIRA